jgi:hypothetical protein
MPAMKPLHRSLLSSLLAFSMPALALHAQAPAGGDPFVKGAPASGAPAQAKEPDPGNSLLVMEVYSLDKIAAAAIFDSERGNAARYRRVTDLAAGGKARLQILTALATKNGQRAANESTEEVRYPATFVPAQTKQDIPAALDWNMRKTGDTIEFEPVILPDGRTFDVNLAPTRVCLAGFRDIGSLEGGSVVFQPQFASQKMILRTVMAEGEPHLLGTFSPPTTVGAANGAVASQVWLAFIHIILQKPGAMDRPAAKPANSSEVHLEYTCYSLDRALAREILLGPALSPAPWDKVQALLGDKGARLEHVISVTASSGQRTASDETQECFYATESNPTQWAGTTQNNRRTTTTGPTPENQDAPAPKEGGKAVTITETVETNRTEPNTEKVPGTATAFETRYLGVSIEAEPVISADGSIVDVNEVFQSSAYLGDLKATGAGARYTPQPVFQTRKLTTAQVIPTGRSVLVGTLNPPVADGVSEQTDAGRTWLVFIRATPNEP